MIDHRELTAIPECTTNCAVSTTEGTIVNLHPEFPIPADKLHEDGAFPWTEDTLRVAREGSRIVTAEDFARERLYGGSHLPSIEWKHLKKSWSLDRRGKSKLSKQQYENHHERFGYSDPITGVEDWLCRFLAKTLQPKPIRIFDAAAKRFGEAYKLYPSETRRFEDHYWERMRTQHANAFFEVVRDYFASYTEFSQTLQYQLREMPVPEGALASSADFNQTKMFYGNAYEALTSNISVLACMNNILCGRPFDVFESMDLNKYLTIDKANRSNPFKSNLEFAQITNCIDSKIRNASHHGGMEFNLETKIISYRSGGKGELRTIPYLDYIARCNDIYIACASLQMLEILLSARNLRVK